ncbi:hypothetical protein H8J86_16290 [Clostridium perfringens]|uniref:hypothetical protein n=1 Tax=Clostridium perfringens TaxID=1502 RepID=UPI001158E330|nr:hypothetical protein [Clostridium perfringens]ELC8349202.1 hypothetical protein [Clostridium perfringens]MBI6007489.1 hypothetical protein [Clostridium perfringens]MBI6089083.1 hypothetical protein [Clostridium perfringens]MBI6094531.1 hypothetical protein [Clostridium perfringens]MDK0530738.1 hypothetical protein [Clostridium perfringens]
MMNEKEIKELLKSNLKEYIKCLQLDSLHSIEYGSACMTCIKILNMDYKFLNLERAERLLLELN